MEHRKKLQMERERKAEIVQTASVLIHLNLNFSSLTYISFFVSFKLLLLSQLTRPIIIMTMS